MNIKFKLLLLSLTICISQNSLANTKVKMTSTESEDNYVLKDSIVQIKPNVLRYWTETIYKEDISDEYGLLYKKDQYIRKLEENNCKEKTKRVKSITLYNKDGTVVRTSTIKDSEVQTHYIVPNSYGEEHMKQICKIKGIR